MWWFVGGERVEGALNRSRTGVRRCETTLKKWNIFEKKKNIPTVNTVKHGQ